ncbi:ankyrin repeat protein [Pigeonpox virus]|uniref:Ankyrin repeat protein n=1 Tax=Pigeonpox virus TaxID=10264 RepID=A0A068EL42_9POXV|nr:ankyrin repeat protein [Pigeonpox virus]AID46727.1 ankyrin repeat protein [Pigeonpox virus]WCL40168.1 ankyrin repeat protein [Pigeonpox virus]
MWVMYKTLLLVDNKNIHYYNKQIQQVYSNIDRQYKIPYLPLHQATECRNYTAVSYLLEYGNNINSIDFKGRSPLHIVCSKPKVNEIIKLLENDSDYDSNIVETYKNYVNNKIYNRVSSEILKQLLSNKQKTLHDMLKHTIDNETAIINLLISKGYSINHQDYSGNTPLHLAVKTRNIDAVKMLISSGASPSIKNRHGFTSLHHAITYSDNDILGLLVSNCIKRGISIDSSLIYTAIRTHNLEGIKILLDKADDFNINGIDNDHMSPLHYAASYMGDVSIVKYLIEKGANVNHRSGIFKRTPIFVALRNYEITKLLLSKGADINVTDSYGNTAIVLAFSKYMYIKEETIRLLVSYISLMDSNKNFVKNHGYKNNLDFIIKSDKCGLIKRECDQEIDKMKKTKLYKYSLYSLIFEYSKHYLYRLVNKEELDRDYISNEFPIYKDMILCCLEKSVNRRISIEKCIRIIDNNIVSDNITSWNNIPIEIKQYIVELLDDNDICKICEQ